MILDAYIGRSTVRGFLLVVSLLLTLFSLFELLAQLDHVGRGSYRVWDAFAFVALTIPRRLADLTPIAALLGSTVALGGLADRQELTAMQAAGMPLRRMASVVVATGVALLIAAVLIAEFVAPPLDQHARTGRFQSIYGGGIKLTKQGFWVRHGGSYVHVAQVFSGGRVADVEVFEFDEQGAMRRFLSASQGHIRGPGLLVLTDADATDLTREGIVQRVVPEYRIEEFLSPGQVEVAELPPESLSVSDLYRSIRVLERRGQNADRHLLAFWQKICLPATIPVMMLLSLTFLFGPTRVRSAWQRIMLGLLIGTLAYLLNRIMGQLSLVLHLPPPWLILPPFGAMLLVAARCLRRAL